MVDRGQTFLVRVVGSLARKPLTAGTSDNGPPSSNPFLPYDPELFVADFPPKHVCLLNKYNVVEGHVLVVTREFRPQTEPLDEGDFSALAICIAADDGLAFYNGGPAAGASQPHKHLQWMPVSPSEMPLAASLRAAIARRQLRALDLPFEHAVAPWGYRADESLSTLGQSMARTYRALLEEVRLGVKPKPTAEIAPYNLVIARDWMLVVPRVREHFDGISLNALAFVGALLVKDDAQWNQLHEAGPWRALAAVSLPRRERSDGAFESAE